MNKTNTIDKSAKIHPNVLMGSYNKIGKNVIIDIIENNNDTIVNIGDNNIFNDNCRIYVNGSFMVGDLNIFHNDMLLMPEKYIRIGHNCWFGQNTILDGAGGLVIGNGVRVGMYSQIWTHVASGERIEGCTLFAKRETKIDDDVWLVGSCIVGSGIELGKRSVILINSLVTKDTAPHKTYSGSPAKIMENLNFYKPISIEDKFNLLKVWLLEYCNINSVSYLNDEQQIILTNKKDNEKVIFTKKPKVNFKANQSVFYLIDKTYQKTNIKLERSVYKYLYGNMARFTPLN